jgi:hypothetical protein
MKSAGRRGWLDSARLALSITGDERRWSVISRVLLALPSRHTRSANDYDISSQPTSFDQLRR